MKAKSGVEIKGNPDGTVDGRELISALELLARNSGQPVSARTVERDGEVWVSIEIDKA